MSPRARSIVGLIEDGVLDAELAALVWLLVEARLPVTVVGHDGGGRSLVRDPMLDLLPPDALPVPLAGADEDFEWLPEATELGWRRERPAVPATESSRSRATSSTAVLVVDGLGDDAPGGTSGPRARIVIRALALGYTMVATMAGSGLEDMLAVLRAAPVAADDDELSRLGIVLVVESVPGVPAAPADRWRVSVAHYVRPVVRDAHGHVQRLPPAVLAAWDPRTDRFEHFAWGIAGELAAVTGRRPVELEREQARRASFLSGLAAAGIVDPAAVRTAIGEYRHGLASGSGR